MRHSNTATKNKILSNITIDERGCWNWNKGIHNGYGVIWNNGKMKRVHRLAYQLFVGKIPTNLCIDHLCRNPACCNPKHLEPVTSRENLKRGFKATNHPYYPRILKPARARGRCEYKNCHSLQVEMHREGGKVYYQRWCTKHLNRKARGLPQLNNKP